MSGDVINLRTARKARQRNAAQALAATNRARFGRTTAEKQRDEQARDLADRLIDGAQRVAPEAERD
ncbi:DUF4169 family protein [Novosphingobium lentum]|uniref:DUF4169 family protein n=1 Tax=Novosphingobium lentum TaxID=145287 RepID=UPI00082DA766|nr:DUF4169 family protein [Novosphingobium lentum]